MGRPRKDKSDTRTYEEIMDVKASKPCRFKHKYQHVEVDKDGYVWQLCYGCDQKLIVR